MTEPSAVPPVLDEASAARAAGGAGDGGAGGGRAGGGRAGGGGGGRRRRPAPLRAVVVDTERLSPHLVRVTVSGDEFERYRWPGPAGHFKLTIPNPGDDDVFVPEPDAQGTVDFAGAVRTMRTYTARRYDPQTRRLSIDVVLHGSGPVAQWAAVARPGDRLAVSIPNGAGFTPNADADWVLLAGDASSLPAIATIAEVLTKPTQIFVQLTDPGDQVYDIGHLVDWLTPGDGRSLEQAVATYVRPPGRGQIWVAAEAGVIRTIRTDLLAAGVAPEDLTTRGYWRAGDENHPDHDHGD